jgi:sugar fermentation stimulation protein A
MPAARRISIQLGDLVEARFLERPNRFVIEAELAGDGSRVVAHLADPGRLEELLLERRRLWLRRAPSGKRKTLWSAALVERPDGRGLVSLDTTLANRLVRRALEHAALEELAEWRLVRAEAPSHGSRFDFLLAHHQEERRMLLEVKSVTLAEEGRGLFPDAVTARGTHHLETLARVASRGEHDAALLFVAQRGDVEQVEAAAHIDPHFAVALDAAREAGVRLLARRCRLSAREIVLGAAVPVLVS